MAKKAKKRGPQSSGVSCAVCKKVKLSFTNTSGVCTACQQEKRAVLTASSWASISAAQHALDVARAAR